MKETIIKYFKYKIMCKISMKKRLDHFEELIEQLYEITAGQQLIIDEYKDESYKTKFKEEHKKRIALEKESKEIIEKFTNEMKLMQKENPKLKKEA